jgi:Ca2+-binding EF-hand superfamily protein
LHLIYQDNGDGDLNEQEFVDALGAIKNSIKEKDARALMQRLDEDGDGRISYREFQGFVDKKKELQLSEVKAIDDTLAAKIREILKCQDQDIKRLFGKFDRNGDGKVSQKEFLKTAEKLHLKLTDEELLGLMKRFDKDGDGRISCSEFVDFIENKKPLDPRKALYKKKPEQSSKALGGAVGGAKIKGSKGALTACELCERSFFSASGLSTLCMDCRKGKGSSISSPTHARKEKASTKPAPPPGARPSSSSTPGQCPQGHDLVPFVTEEDGWTCSSCDTPPLPAGETLHQCAECEYDLCVVCSHKNSRVDDEKPLFEDGEVPEWAVMREI